VPAAFATVGTPDSFADEEYYSVDAFVFVNKAGERQAVRYQMMPERVVHLAAADAAKQPPNFLMDELPERLKRGPVTFHLRAQLAADQCPADDRSRRRRRSGPLFPGGFNRSTQHLLILPDEKVCA
jgi:catalase